MRLVSVYVWTGLVVWCATLGSGSGARAPAGSCPAVCTCKWKGGKQTVECMDRGLIAVPELVDPANQVLDMSGNNLQILPREAFERTGLTNLQKVYLRNCKLGQIDDQAFKGLTNLVELDLSYNLLTHIPSATFQDTPFLRDLIVSHNPIQKVPADSLRTLSNLVKLDLSHCELRDMSDDAFRNVRLLESLKLNGNKLRELPPHALYGLEKLRTIELYENPWICDCRLRELKVWITKHNVPSTVAPTCAGGPPRVADRTFGDLHVDDFACKPEILPVSRYVEATTGDNATVACRAGAVPPATVNWYWNGRLLVNNSAFTSHQKLYIFEEGRFEKKSSLVLTNAQETDSGEFYCVADNRAGSAEANFTLHVSMRAAGMATLGGAQIASLGAAIFLIIVVILLIILVLLVRLRGSPACESKTPGRIENPASSRSTDAVSPGDKSGASTHDVADEGARGNGVAEEVKCNPVQKPPRVVDIPYSTNHYDGRGSLVAANGPPVVSPTASAGNDPDLINDMRSESSAVRPSSGEYARAASDSLYPSGMWEQEARAQASALSRAAAAAMPAFYSDKTPIMDSCSVESSQEELGFGKAAPRAPANGYPSDYGLPLAGGGRALRVWQRAPPVLPPVTALKRVLVSSRSSPDEGYQEGCGTDV